MWTSDLLELAGVVLGLALFCWTILRLRRWAELRRVRRRFRRGARGQRKARGFLQRRGFEILAEEYELEAHLEVDGELHPYQVRVDYLVRRGGRVYGVEVKTGSRAPDPLHRPTRRQLLEYSQLLDEDGLYLLDMEQRRLMRVRFRGPRRRGGSGWLLALLCGFVLGAAAAFLLQR